MINNDDNYQVSRRQEAEFQEFSQEEEHRRRLRQEAEDRSNIQVKISYGSRSFLITGCLILFDSIVCLSNGQLQYCNPIIMWTFKYLTKPFQH